MSLSNTDSKYINLALSELFEDALTYRKMSLTMTHSMRQRATYKALAQAFAQAYNRLARTIRHLGTSALAQDNKYLHPRNFNPLTDTDIDELLVEAYGVSVDERRAAIIERNKELATAEALSPGYPPHVQAALQVLAETGTLSKFLNTAEAMGISPINAAKTPFRTRGNPVKGGLVKKYLDKGNTLDEAHLLAEMDILKAETNPEQRIQEISNQLAPDIRAALAQVEREEKPKPQLDDGAKMLAIINAPAIAEEVEPEPEITINPLTGKASSDADFNDPEDL